MPSCSVRGFILVQTSLLFAVVVLLCILVSLPEGTLNAKLNPSQIVAELEHKFNETELLIATSPLDDQDIATPPAQNSTKPLQAERHHPPCWNLPGAEDILLVLKTGATEIYTKLPAHFLTTFQCAPNILLVSDLGQYVGMHRVHDILAEVSASIVDKNPDFELYRKQKQWGKELQDMRGLPGGWTLDKWKFLPMVKRAYREHPHKSWYLFMEADTYISWANFLAWLQRLNHTQPLYLGGESFIGGTRFAHGGSGFVISQAALRRVADIEPVHGAKWESSLPYECCGDKVLADALLDADVQLTQSAPGIQSDEPNTIRWTRSRWCTPAMSWHHVTSAEVDALWQFEQKWLKKNGPGTPILFSDYFAHFVQPYLRPTRLNWDNLSDEWTFSRQDALDGATGPESNIAKKAHKSASECRNACKGRQECVQYSYEPDICRLSSVIILGRPDDEGTRRVESGWLLGRIKKLRSELEPCDPDQHWVLP